MGLQAPGVARRLSSFLAGMDRIHARHNRLAMPVRLPGGCDHIRHVRAAHEAGPGQGELPVAIIDRIHGLVQPIKPVLFFFTKEFLLSPDRSRIQRRDLHLEDAFSLPVLADHLFAQRDHRAGIVGRKTRPEMIAAKPALAGAKADEIALRGQGVLSQARTELLGHVHQVHEEGIAVGGIRGGDLAVAHGLGVGDPGFHRGRIFASTHLPDAPTRVAETVSQHTDRKFGHIPAGDGPAPRQKSCDAFIDSAKLGEGHILEPPACLPGQDNGEAIGFFLLGGILGSGLVPADAHGTGKPRDLSHPRLDHRSHHFGGLVPVALAVGKIQERLVDGENLDVRGDVLQGRHDTGGDLDIALGTGRDLDNFRTQLLGLFQACANVDAVGPRLIGAGDETGAGAAVGDADRAAPVFGMVQLFDGCEKGIHVHEGNGARPGLCVVRHGTMHASEGPAREQ